MNSQEWQHYLCGNETGTSN